MIFTFQEMYLIFYLVKTNNLLYEKHFRTTLSNSKSRTTYEFIIIESIDTGAAVESNTQYKSISSVFMTSKCQEF